MNCFADKKRTALELVLLNLLRFCIYEIYKQHRTETRRTILVTMRKYRHRYKYLRLCLRLKLFINNEVINDSILSKDWIHAITEKKGSQLYIVYYLYLGKKRLGAH